MPDHSPRDALLEWLQETHVMARHGQTMLSARADSLDSHPQLAERLAAHARQTGEQAARIADCIERMGEVTSSVLNAAGKLSAIGHSLGTRIASEQAVQAHAASYAFEHFEIANYKALVAAAARADEAAIKATCEVILEEQQEMAAWLGARLDDTPAQYLDAIT